MRAAWASAVNRSLRSVDREMVTDVSAYTIAEMPTRMNFLDHSLTLMPLPGSRDWYRFRPVGDTYQAIFDIVDSHRRLGKILLTEIDTGDRLGMLKASANGARLSGRLTLPWSWSMYRVEGYSKTGKLMFRLAASNGGADRVGHFTVKADYAPKRPPSESLEADRSDDQPTAEPGSPFDSNGGTISKPGLGFSRTCLVVRKTNDVGTTNPLQPPRSNPAIFRKSWIGNLDTNKIAFCDLSDAASLRRDIDGAKGQDNTEVLSRIEQSPYSDSIGHWHVRFDGEDTAFFAIPYQIWKRRELRTGLISAVQKQRSAVIGKTGRLSSLLYRSYLTWLKSRDGKRFGYHSAMVAPMGDIMTVAAHEELRHIAAGNFLPAPCAISIVPDIAPPVGFEAAGRADRVAVAPGVVGTPPHGPAFVGLNFQKGSATVMLAKGYRWKASAQIINPRGYVIESTEFSSPVERGSITLRARLTVCLALTVNTNAPCSLVLKSESGRTFAAGDAAGKQAPYRWTITGVPPGVYTVEATAGQKHASRLITVPIDAAYSVDLNPLSR